MWYEAREDVRKNARVVRIDARKDTINRMRDVSIYARKQDRIVARYNVSDKIEYMQKIVSNRMPEYI